MYDASVTLYMQHANPFLFVVSNRYLCLTHPYGQSLSKAIDLCRTLQHAYF